MWVPSELLVIGGVLGLGTEGFDVVRGLASSLLYAASIGGGGCGNEKSPPCGEPFLSNYGTAPDERFLQGRLGFP